MNPLSTPLLALLLPTAPLLAQSTTGTGCPGFGGLVPAVELRSGVIQGYATIADLNGAPSTPCLLLASANNSSYLGTPLPLDLGSIDAGLAGCTLYQAPNLILPIALDATGAAELEFQSWPTGVTAYFQLWNLDFDPLPGGNLGGISPGYSETACAEGGPLFPGEVLPTGTTAGSIQHADFDGDGRVDLAVSNWGSNNVSILRGLGGQEFAPAVNFPVFQHPNGLAVADFDLDGRLDLVTSNRCDDSPLCSFGNVSVLYGRSEGGFEPVVEISDAGTYASDVVVADLDGDGRDDVIFANSNSEDIRLIRNIGPRQFADAGAFQMGERIAQVEVADLNGDGLFDLLCAFEPGGMVLRQGTGNGTVGGGAFGSGSYGPATPIPGTTDVRSFRLADFNADSVLDLAVDDTPGLARVLIGSGTGSFAETQALCEIGIFGELFTADLNVDGAPDLIVRGKPTGAADSRSDIWLNDGQGAFHLDQVIESNVGARSVFSARTTAYLDLDGDGFPELIEATPDFGGVAIRPSRCFGGYASTPLLSQTVRTRPLAIERADLDGDGWLDLLVGSPQSLDLHVLFGLPGAELAPAVELDLPQSVSNLELGDIDGDGRLDAVLLDEEPGRVSVLLGVDSTALFTPAGGVLDLGGQLTDLSLGDLDGDGRLDVAVSDFANDEVLVLLGTGLAATPLSSPQRFPAGDGPNGVAIGQLNADGLPDLAVTNGFADVVRVLLADGSGGFGAPQGYGYVLDGEPGRVQARDLDQDGVDDLIVAYPGANLLSVMYGSADGSFFETYPLPTELRPTDVAIDDFNLDGLLDVASNNAASYSVTVALGTADRNFTEPRTFQHRVSVSPSAVGFAAFTTGDFDRDGAPDFALCARDFATFETSSFVWPIDILRNQLLE